VGPVTILKDSAATASANVVADTWSVITTTLFGSAPLSTEVLDVEVVAGSLRRREPALDSKGGLKLVA
jgi:hypothetical protein